MNFTDTKGMVRRFGVERRKYQRFKLRGQVELSWTGPDRKPRTTSGNLINISTFGVLVETPCSIPLGAEVELRAETLSILGSTTVAHCRHYGVWFRVGLRFATPEEAAETFKNALGNGIEVV